jgi:hypothetical protein
MRPLPAALFAAVLLSAPAAGAVHSGRLDTLEVAVAQKRLDLGPPVGPGTRAQRAADRVLRILDRARETLLDDLRLGRAAARVLDRVFPADPSLDPALTAAFTSLQDGTMGERAALLAWAGHTGSARSETRLQRGIDVVQGSVDRGDAAAARAAKARWWRRACLAVERTRRDLHLAAPPVGPPPFQGLAPDFSLVDANPNSATSGAAVSPRDHAGRLTAWYFTRLT